MEKFTDILGAVRKDSGSTFRSCEPELIELMRQIDNMVEEKKKEWSEQISALQLQLQQKIDENLRIYQDLEAANYEVGALHQEVAGLKNIKKSLVTKYENTVKKFKEEVDLLKKKYDRLQKKTNRFQTQKTIEFQNIQNECHIKTTEIINLQTAVRNFEEQEKKYRMELENCKNYAATIEAQKESLSEKCETMQGSLLNYQTHLNRKQETLQSLEQGTAFRIADLETKVCSQQKTCEQQELEIKSLKLKLNDLNKVSNEWSNNGGKNQTRNETLEKIYRENEQLKSSIKAKEKVIQRYEQELVNLSKQFSPHSFEDYGAQGHRSPLHYDFAPHVKHEEKIRQLEMENSELHKRLVELKDELASTYNKSFNQQQDSLLNGRRAVERKAIEDYRDSEESSTEARDTRIPLSPASEFTQRELQREENLDKKIKSRIHDLEKLF